MKNKLRKALAEVGREASRSTKYVVYVAPDAYRDKRKACCIRCGNACKTEGSVICDSCIYKTR